MSKYYTFVDSQSGKIFHRYVEDGQRKEEVISQYPYELFIPCPYGQYKALDGTKLERVTFDTINEMNDYCRTKPTSSVFGNTSAVQQFITKEYPGEIKIDNAAHVTLNFDIEVEHDNGFPKPEDANDAIMSISYEAIQANTKIINYTLGLKEYTGDDSDLIYIQCDSEKELLSKFIAAWRDIKPDFVTGWNINTFDIPYLITRCNKVLGVAQTNKLSPFSAYCRDPIKQNKRAPQLQYNILGVTQLDYLELYLKYSPVKLESYKLDFVSEYELKENKVRFDEYGGNLMRLYRGEYEIESNEKEKLSEKDRWCRLRTMLKDKVEV